MSYATQLRAIMPGLSDLQYEQRERLMVARDFSAARLGDATLAFECWHICKLIGSMAQQMIYRELSDADLAMAVDYCRALARAFTISENIFGGRTDGQQG